MSPNTERLQRVHTRTLLMGMPLLSLVMVVSAALVYRQPVHSAWQWLAYLLMAAICLALLLPTRAAARRGDKLRIVWIGLVLFHMLCLLMLVRIIALLFDVAVRDPEMSLFAPVFALLPCLYLGALLLLGSRIALAASWTMWAVVVAVIVVAMLFNGLTMRHHGSLELAFWLLVGNPLFLILMQALPDLEDALHRAEAEIGELRCRNQLLARVSASEQRFNRVVDSLQVGVWDQQFVAGEIGECWWSPRFYALLGYQPDELAATEQSVDFLLGEDAETIRKPTYLRLRKSGVAAFDARLRTKDRGLCWFNIVCKAEFDKQGRFIRMTGAIEDIHLRYIAEQELLAAQAELVSLAYRDALTELPNRRAFDGQLQREWDRARRGGQPLSLLSIDIDWFKNYNDRYGHPAGDECLRGVAKILSSNIRRPSDFAARVGGEEFQILLPETDVAGAYKIASQMEAALRREALPHVGSPLAVLTCSIGVATTQVTGDEQMEQFVERADANLYESKRRGRGQVS